MSTTGLIILAVVLLALGTGTFAVAGGLPEKWFVVPGSILGGVIFWFGSFIIMLSLLANYISIPATDWAVTVVAVVSLVFTVVAARFVIRWAERKFQKPRKGWEHIKSKGWRWFWVY